MRRRSAFLFATSRASRIVPSEAEARRGARGAARRAGARRPLAHRAAARAQASRHHDGISTMSRRSPRMRSTGTVGYGTVRYATYCGTV